MNYEVFEDKENRGDWRVEGSDIQSGDVEIAIFSGASAELRAREYYRGKTDPDRTVRIILKSGMPMRLFLDGLDWEYDDKRQVLKARNKNAISAVPESIGGAQ